MGKLKKLYMEIWNERPQTSEISGLPLLHSSHPKFVWQFAHILSKGAYPEYKYKKENIMLILPEEHEKQEEYEAFLVKRDLLKQQYYKEIYNKQFD